MRRRWAAMTGWCRRMRRIADGAFAFIEFMAQPQIVSEGWNTGRLPPRTDIVIDNPQWPQAYAIYHEQLQSARARGPHPQWPDLSRPMQTAIQEAITGKRTAAEALADAAKKIQPILAKTPLSRLAHDQATPPCGGGRGAEPAQSAPSPRPPPARGGGESARPCSTSSSRYRSSTCWRWSAFPVAYNILMSLQDVTLGNIVDAHPPVGRLRQLPRGPGRSRLPQGSAQLAAVRRRQCGRPTRHRPRGRAVLLAALSRRAFPARPAARRLDAAGAGGRRAVEMAVRHRSTA